MATSFSVPWRLVQNKIVRYPGGREIDRFRGIYPGEDDGRPEAWVGSVTSVVYADEDNPNDGRAEVMLPGEERIYLFEAIARDPEAALGREHVAQYGDNPGLLVKLLDAKIQLGLQCHPDRAYAKAHWNSDYGKAECWYIIALREDADEPPYVLLGFREGVTRADFERGYEACDITALEGLLHKIPARIGDVFNVAPGVPHAVGAGCFLVEVQEPSDITVGASKKRGATPEQEAAHKERLLGAYQYDGADLPETLRRYRIEPTVLDQQTGGCEELLIGPEQTPYYSLTRVTATARFSMADRGRCMVLIVLSGSGTLRCEDGALVISKADEVFVPASAKHIVFEPKDGEPLVVACCHPPGTL